MCKKCRLHLPYTSLPSIHFSSHSELYVFNVSFVKLNVTMLSCHAVMGFCTCMQKEQMWPPCSQSPWGRLQMQILQNPWSKCPKTLKFTGIFFSCRLYSLTSLTLTSKEESTVEAAVAQTTQNVHMLSKSSWQSALRWCSVQTTSRTWLNGCSYSASLCLKGWEEKDSKDSLFISAHEVHPTIKKLFKEQWLWSTLDIKRGSAFIFLLCIGRMKMTYNHLASRSFLRVSPPPRVSHVVSWWQTRSCWLAIRTARRVSFVHWAALTSVMSSLSAWRQTWRTVLLWVTISKAGVSFANMAYQCNLCPKLEIVS